MEDGRTLNWATDTIGPDAVNFLNDLTLAAGTAVAGGLGAALGTIAMPGAGTMAGGIAGALGAAAYMTKIDRDDRNKAVKRVINTIFDKNFDTENPDLEPELLELIKKQYGPYADYERATISTAALNSYRITEKNMLKDFYGNIKKKVKEELPTAPPAVQRAAAGASSTSGGTTRSITEIIKEIQRIIGQDPATGKWTKGVTDVRLTTYIATKNPNLVGATIAEVSESWKSNGPKITNVNGTQKTFTGDAAGLLDFLKIIGTGSGESTAPSVVKTEPTTVSATDSTAQAAEPGKGTVVGGLAKVLRLIEEGTSEVDTKGFDLKMDTGVWVGVIKGLGGSNLAAIMCNEKISFTLIEQKVLVKLSTMNDEDVADKISGQTFLEKVGKYFYSLKKGRWGATARREDIAQSVKDNPPRQDAPK
jgi:hypothetical protein